MNHFVVNLEFLVCTIDWKNLLFLVYPKYLSQLTVFVMLNIQHSKNVNILKKILMLRSKLLEEI